METRDRAFAEIALKLQLLTRSQVKACVAHAASQPGVQFEDCAIELGYLTREEAELVRGQDQRNQRGQQRVVAPTEVVEERAMRIDPRAASGPARAPTPVAPAAAAQRPQVARGQQWAASADPQRAVVRVPQAMPPPPPPGARGATVPLRGGGGGRPGEPALGMDAAAAAWQTVSQEDHGFSHPSGAPNRVDPRGAQFEPDPYGEQDVLQLSAQPAPSVRPVRSPASLAPTQPVHDMVARVPSAPPAPPPVVEARPTPLPTKVNAIRPIATGGNAGYLGKALALALRHGASDLHVHSGAPVMMRVDGEMRVLSGNSPMPADAAERVIAEVMTDEQWTRLAEKGEIDFAYALAGVGRFRVNVYRQQRGLDCVFRLIPERPPTLEELGLPARLARLVDFRTGLVLCTGPTGCGKSTTLAALLSSLVADRAEHVLTIEDPVEFVLPQGVAVVNQRQVRDHTMSFSRALRAALREDPDVIAITDLRDRETMSLAITAAETGHLVLASLHTSNASQTISRIIGSFAPEEREQIRVMLAESLRAIVSQRLMPRASGKGRIPAIELLMVNTAVSSLIRDDKTFQLPSVLQTGKAAGMITLDDSIAESLQAGLITADVARRFCVRKERFANAQ